MKAGSGGEGWEKKRKIPAAQAAAAQVAQGQTGSFLRVLAKPASFVSFCATLDPPLARDISSVRSPM